MAPRQHDLVNLQIFIQETGLEEKSMSSNDKQETGLKGKSMSSNDKQAQKENPLFEFELIARKTSYLSSHRVSRQARRAMTSWTVRGTL